MVRFRKIPRRTFRFVKRHRRAIGFGASLAAGGYLAAARYGGRAAAIGASRALLSRYQYHPVVSRGMYAYRAARGAYARSGRDIIRPTYRAIRNIKAAQIRSMNAGRLAHARKMMPRRFYYSKGRLGRTAYLRARSAVRANAMYHP